MTRNRGIRFCRPHRTIRPLRKGSDGNCWNISCRIRIRLVVIGFQAGVLNDGFLLLEYKFRIRILGDGMLNDGFLLLIHVHGCCDDDEEKGVSSYVYDEYAASMNVLDQRLEICSWPGRKLLTRLPYLYCFVLCLCTQAARHVTGISYISVASVIV
jgi:hypothetical protein